MTDATETFEVQALVMKGDRGGQWDAIGGNAMTSEQAEQRATELRLCERQPFRVMPFGGGPLGRVGDVSPGGAILTDDDDDPAYVDGRHYRQGGKAMLLPEQADNAELFGWRRTGKVSGSVSGGDLMVEVAL